MLNGVILSEDRIVARVHNGLRKVVDQAHCPLYLQKYDDVEGWLTRRSIDAHRDKLPPVAESPAVSSQR